MNPTVNFEQLVSAYTNRIQSYTIKNSGHINLTVFLDDAFFTVFEPHQTTLVQQFHFMKTCAVFEAEFRKGENNEVQQNLYVQCGTHLINSDTDLQQWFNEHIREVINTRIEEFEIRGSGWTLDNITQLIVHNNRYEPIRGSSYIKLAPFIQKKHAIVNVKNHYDEKCFKWAILSALHPARNNVDRLINYLPFEDTLDFSGIIFPVQVNQVQLFERLNPTISINVYACDEQNKVIPIRLTGEVKQQHLHLFLIQELVTSTNTQNDDDVQIKSHYCWIKDLSKLLHGEVTKHNRKLIFCDRCLQYFHNIEKLSEHVVYCMCQNNCAIKLPSNDNRFIKFKNFNYQLKVPFCVYADLESILKPVINQTVYTSDNTKAYQVHEPFSIGYYFKCDFDDTKSYYRSYRGLDCTKWFAHQLEHVFNLVYPIYKKIVLIEINEHEENLFQNANSCHICMHPFTSGDDDAKIKVRDHNHLTGKYRGAAHQSCNLKYQETRVIPVIFHNLSGYDAHFIVPDIATAFDGDMHIIPVTDQNYITFTKTVECSRSKRRGCQNFGEMDRNTIKFKFLDSFRFMASALDKLASYLPSSSKPILYREFASLVNQNRVKLLERKGVFPYDYISSWNKLDECELPPQEEFYSQLTDTHISDDEYQFAQLVWREFNIENIGEYADLYMKTDILLLADIFENFRMKCFEIYKLDPCHYFTTPGFSFDAMLKYTQIEIELLTDIDMLLFVERGIRGGICQCSKRYCKANNRFMGDDYDPAEPTSYLIYLDVNNLYGYAMMQPLPLNEFTWIPTPSHIDQITEIVQDPNVGCIIEVDLKYDASLHDAHQDYPLCAETMKPPGGKHEKLLLTLNDKKNYVIHHKMLDFVIKHGLIVTKIHRVLKFNQCRWLKPFIDLNTEHRTLATNDFEKNLFKLMSNAIYGKTMENVRNRREIKLRCSWEGRYGVRNMIASPNFKKSTVFSEQLVAIEMMKTEVFLNKPIIIGMAVLDISKLVMVEFHYDYMKPKYGNRCELAYTDTDSYVYHISNIDNFYSDMKSDIHLYDTSDYAVDNSYSIPHVNKKVPGLMKDELCGQCCTEFVGLRSKMYAIRVQGQDRIKKAKGVKAYVLKKKISFENYLDCIRQNCTLTHTQNTIRSKDHHVHSIQQKRLTLNPHDDKRFIEEDNIHTLPWGHYKINNN